MVMTQPRRADSDPRVLGLDALRDDDRALLTPAVIARWTRDLGPEDTIEAAALLRLEHQRLRSLATIRNGIELNDNEFRAVRYLQRRAGEIVSAAELAAEIWPLDDAGRRLVYQPGGGRGNSTADRHLRAVYAVISSLRRKLEVDPLRPQHIAAIRGVGYAFYGQPPAADDGIDYGEREVVAREMRAARRLGLPPTEADARKRLGGGRGRPQLGPAHPDYAARDWRGVELVEGTGFAVPGPLRDPEPEHGGADDAR